jgi:hypothetical protein
VLAAVAYSGQAHAWAWPMEAGETQAILKYELEDADEGFDENGLIVPIPEQHDENLSLFIEHGLTERVTLQGKLGWTRGDDLFNDYEGRGPIDLGARYLAFKGRRTVVSLYAGATLAGEGRNAAYSTAGEGNVDAELRFLAGRSGTLWKRHMFGELQVARLAREGLPDETRIETTVGWHPARNWLLLFQNYAGRAEAQPVAPMWLKSEVSVVRDLGRWRLQGGWRSTSLGVEMPNQKGPVLALWRRF